jgi:arginyl-tRNA synthetase
MRQEIEQLIAGICRDLFNLEIKVDLSRPDEQFGDYATNIALQLAGKLGKNPREIAESIQNSIDHTNIQSTTIAGPGFLNITLKDHAVVELVGTEIPTPLKGKVVVAEYSDPNPFKALHAGHLYTTIIGDAIASLLEKAGAKVRRVNFGGDVGLHVAKAMYAIVQSLGGEYPEKLETVDSNSRPEWVSERYVEGNQAYESDETAKQNIIEMNKKVYLMHEQNDHSSALAQIYWTCRQWSYDGFETLYKKLQVHSFDKYYPESETTPKGLELVKQGLEDGLFEKSDGAVVLKGEYHGLHTRVFLNSEGLPTYEAKDLGLAAEKWQAYQPDINIIITANDIVEYMRVVLAAVKHFYPAMAAATKHLTHGMIKLAGGAKMSSRKGNVLLANDVLEAAVKANRGLTGQDNFDAVLAAVKYAFLKQRSGSDIIYDANESVNLLGHSGPYLQYAHARARSILVKASKNPIKPDDLQPDERLLLRKIGEYQEVFEQAVQELLPSHICTYLYELAQIFNGFYEKNRVLDDEREPLRLWLVEHYADTLKNGLGLLNIPSPERM